ncbi:acylneuraminate cytidylyltransferase family protein [Leptospira levettii]|uniref:Acylneuraminate cytidylyltransferase family protein n=1 Tax=Leptospira levettii TaxID=2023178 RepID=A0AAW5V765_9LEPT|nr:acylneuraminate cytidylyltransferase family protein [Leptospira levettii]MCW7466198.1 acylneuraminate cytidylyltransferase family protein [Leptospira levettii]MCW7512277.1 acylneuraminate cytidylyltransferase family protein [Leptospira levettii]MCW7516285.1 acylneuraminate cytidylyltransferase family protein [Leptospira levettii]
MKNVVAIILARGGSKGIPKKNIMDFCGKPLINWTIEQCLGSPSISSVWVSSDSEEILKIANEAGANQIKRPEDIANDTATSELGWIHAIEYIEKLNGKIDLVVAPQVTSPLRHSSDFENGIKEFEKGNFDSLFSCSVAEDLYFWERKKEGFLESINYDWRNRKRRQDHSPQYIENGSFYLFLPSVVIEKNNRFGNKIGMVEMEFWKLFEIDSLESFRLCEAIMKSFVLV